MRRIKKAMLLSFALTAAHGAVAEAAGTDGTRLSSRIHSTPLTTSVAPATFGTFIVSTNGAPSVSNDIPSSWSDFKTSGKKEDQLLVKQIEKMDWYRVCVAWGQEARKKIKSRRMWAMQEFLQSGHFLNGIDLGGVSGKIPEIGMSTCGAYAVMGLPDAVNRSKGSFGYNVQNVWRARGVNAYSRSASDNGNAVISSVQY